jgi:hypothetical protein
MTRGPSRPIWCVIIAKQAPALHMLPSRCSPVGVSKIKRLSAILRIADGLDRSHFSLFDEMQCKAGSEERMQLQLMISGPGMDMALDLNSAKR